MKTLLKIAGPLLMLIGLLLVARFPQPARDAAEGAASHFLAALDLSGPHWRGGLALMTAGVLCLFVQAFIKE